MMLLRRALVRPSGAALARGLATTPVRAHALPLAAAARTRKEPGERRSCASLRHAPVAALPSTCLRERSYTRLCACELCVCVCVCVNSLPDCGPRSRERAMGGLCFARSLGASRGGLSHRVHSPVGAERWPSPALCFAFARRRPAAVLAAGATRIVAQRRLNAVHRFGLDELAGSVHQIWEGSREESVCVCVLVAHTVNLRHQDFEDVCCRDCPRAVRGGPRAL